MKRTVPGNRPSPRARWGSWRNLLARGLVAALLLAALLGGYHRHHDLASHPDCVICAVAHQTAAAPEIPALPVIILPALPVLFALLVPSRPAFRPTALLRSRAPPR